MTPAEERAAEQRAATDRAAANAVALIRASYAREQHGPPLNVTWRAIQRRAEALARHWVRQDRKRGRL